MWSLRERCGRFARRGVRFANRETHAEEQRCRVAENKFAEEYLFFAEDINYRTAFFPVEQSF